MISFDDLPEIPQSQRPMDLYVRSKVTPEEKKIAVKKGWDVKDVRLIKDASEAIRATFEGARLGTILLSEEDRANLIAEAKMHGVMSAKGPVEKKEKREEESIDKVLSFAKQHAKEKIKVIVPDITDLRSIAPNKDTKS